MNYKRKTSHKRIGRKEGNNQMHSVGEWSRMLHSWWNKDVVAKFTFKKKIKTHSSQLEDL